MKNNGKIGVFDSGLGGIYIAQAIRDRLPSYDYLYMGDTLNIPYGRRSDAAVYDLSEAAMRYLFEQGCEMIVMACNTASAVALRRLQQTFLVNHYPDRRILGVIVPTLETAIEHGAKRIGLLATQRTIYSNIYEIELQKINPAVSLFAASTPLLVPLIEHEGEAYLDMVLSDYLKPLMHENIQSLILGCTHYVALKDRAAKLGAGQFDVISQDDIIPPKLEDYLRRHPEMAQRLSQEGTFDIHVTDANESFLKNIESLLGHEMPVTTARYTV